MSDADKRESRAFEPVLITDPIDRAQAEARNGLLQYDLGRDVIRAACERQEQGGRFHLRLSLVLSLHRAALNGISTFAGNFRPGGVEILNSRHAPPAAHLVPELVEHMCDYINDHWESASAIHLAAYAMWRLNWIHPFADGNGWTSRMLSYVVMAIRSGVEPPGSPTIPAQIVANRQPYFAALDAADAAWAEGRLDLSAMEQLLRGMLAAQLMSYLNQVAGPD